MGNALGYSLRSEHAYPADAPNNSSSAIPPPSVIRPVFTETGEPPSEPPATPAERMRVARKVILAIHRHCFAQQAPPKQFSAELSDQEHRVLQREFIGPLISRDMLAQLVDQGQRSELRFQAGVKVGLKDDSKLEEASQNDLVLQYPQGTGNRPAAHLVYTWRREWETVQVFLLLTPTRDAPLTIQSPIKKLIC